jgi:hypothetical protein
MPVSLGNTLLVHTWQLSLCQIPRLSWELDVNSETKFPTHPTAPAQPPWDCYSIALTLPCPLHHHYQNLHQPRIALGEEEVPKPFPINSLLGPYLLIPC